MAWALQLDGVNDYVSIPQFKPSTNTVIEFDIEFDSLYDWNSLITGAYQGNSWEAWVYADGRIGFRPNDAINALISPSNSVQANVRHTVKFVCTSSSTAEIYVDNSLVVSGSVTVSNTFGFDFIGGGTLNTHLRARIYSVSFDDGLGDSRYYDPSASNGTGDTLIDTAGGNNGTLQNFPTDDSQWIDLGGAVNYDLILDPGSYSYTGNTLSLSVGRKLDLNSGSYSYTGNPITLVYSPASVNYDLVLEPGVYSVTGQPIQLSKGYSLTLNTGNYSYTGEQVSLSYGRSLILDAGSYSIIGYPISLNYSAFVDVRISGYTVKYSQNYYAATYKESDVSAKYKSKDMAMKYGSLQ